MEKINMFKHGSKHGRTCNDYRVAILSKSYITTTGIAMQSLKLIRQEEKS